MTSDPIVIPHNPRIWGIPSPCSTDEWAMTELREGDRVRVTPNPKGIPGRPRRTESYDAVWRFVCLGLAPTGEIRLVLTGEVRIPDPDDLICESVIPECGDRIRPLDRPVYYATDIKRKER